MNSCTPSSWLLRFVISFGFTCHINYSTFVNHPTHSSLPLTPHLSLAFTSPAPPGSPVSSLSSWRTCTSPLQHITSIPRAPGCQLLMSPLGLFNLGISTGWDEGEPRSNSAHSHMKRPTGAEPGQDGPTQGRAGWDRSAGVWVSLETWALQGNLWAATRSHPGALHWRLPSLMSCEQISDARGVLGAVRFPLDCRATPRTRDSLSVTCKHRCYPLSS